MNALELQNVTKEYPGFSLTDISFSLPGTIPEIRSVTTSPVYRAPSGSSF